MVLLANGIIDHGDGSFTVPAGFRGPLPEVPASAYPPDAKPIKPLGADFFGFDPDDEITVTAPAPVTVTLTDTPPDTDPDEDLTEDDSGVEEAEEETE